MFDLKFTYVLAGWEGNADDSQVLNDALSRSRRLDIPEGTVALECDFIIIIISLQIIVSLVIFFFSI